MKDDVKIHEAGSDLFPRKGSNGSSRTRLFAVEVRLDYGAPRAMFGGSFILGSEWQRLPVEFAPAGFVGVPSQTFSKHGVDHGLMSWECANAIRWWGHAASGHFSCLQSRLVEYEIEEQYSMTVLGHHDVIGGGGSDERSRMTHRPLTPPLTEDVPLSRHRGKDAT